METYKRKEEAVRSSFIAFALTIRCRHSFKYFQELFWKITYFHFAAREDYFYGIFCSQWENILFLRRIFHINACRLNMNFAQFQNKLRVKQLEQARKYAMCMKLVHKNKMFFTLTTKHATKIILSSREMKLCCFLKGFQRVFNGTTATICQHKRNEAAYDFSSFRLVRFHNNSNYYYYRKFCKFVFEIFFEILRVHIFQLLKLPQIWLSPFFVHSWLFANGTNLLQKIC